MKFILWVDFRFSKETPLPPVPISSTLSLYWSQFAMRRDQNRSTFSSWWERRMVRFSLGTSSTTWSSGWPRLSSAWPSSSSIYRLSSTFSRLESSWCSFRSPFSTWCIWSSFCFYCLRHSSATYMRRSWTFSYSIFASDRSSRRPTKLASSLSSNWRTL